MPGDYKPVDGGDPVADVLARVYALILSWPAAGEILPSEDEAK